MLVDRNASDEKKAEPPSPRSPSEHVEDVRTLFRDAIPTYFDPVFLVSKNSVIPEHDALAELLDCALTIVRAVEDIKEQNNKKKKGLVENIRVINAAVNKIDGVLSKLEKSPSFIKYLSMLNHFLHECQVYFGNTRKTFRSMINMGLQNEELVFELNDKVMAFVNSYRNKSEMSVVNQLRNDLGGVSGAWDLRKRIKAPMNARDPAVNVFDVLNKALSDQSEPAKKLILALNSMTKNKSVANAEDVLLEQLRERNQILKRLMLAIDEIEVGIGFREGAMVEIVNRFIRGKDKQSDVDITKLIAELNDGMHKLGYKFDPEDQYPYHQAILVQRTKQLEKEKFADARIPADIRSRSALLMQARVDAAKKKVDDDYYKTKRNFESYQLQLLNKLIDVAIEKLKKQAENIPEDALSLSQQVEMLRELKTRFNRKRIIGDTLEEDIKLTKKAKGFQALMHGDLVTTMRDIENIVSEGTVRHSFIFYVNDRIKWYMDNRETAFHYHMQISRLTEFRDVLVKRRGISVKKALKRMLKSDANILEAQEHVLLSHLHALEGLIPNDQENQVVIPKDKAAEVADDKHDDKAAAVAPVIKGPLKQLAVVRQTYHEVINDSIDPIFKDEKAQSILPEHGYIAKFFDGIQAMTSSAFSVGFVQLQKVVDEKEASLKPFTLYGLASSAGAALWNMTNYVTSNYAHRTVTAAYHTPQAYSSYNTIKDALRGLENNPGFVDLLSSISGVAAVYREYVSKSKTWFRENAAEAVSFAKMASKDVQAFGKKVDHFLDVAEQKGNYSAYKLLGGMDGISELIADIDRVSANLSELSLIAISKANQLLKRLLVAIDEMEIGMGFKEGAGLDLVNLFLNRDIADGEKKIDVRHIIDRITKRMNLLGYEFDAQNQYPYTPAILEQRRMLLAKANMIKNPKFCKDELQRLTHDAKAPNDRELFRQLPLIVSYYKVDKAVLEKFKATYDAAWKNDFKDVAELTKARIALFAEMDRNPGSVLPDEIRAKKVMLADSRVKSAEQRCVAELAQARQLQQDKRLARLVCLIDLRVHELQTELKAAWFFKETKQKKIELLTDLKKAFDTEKTVGNKEYTKVITIFSRAPYNRLLFEAGSRTFQMVNNLRSLSDKSLGEVYASKIDEEIARLKASIVAGFTFFHTWRVSVLEKTKGILERLKKNIVENKGCNIDTAITCLQGDEVTFINDNEKKLLGELRQLDIDLPSAIKDRRLIPSR